MLLFTFDLNEDRFGNQGTKQSQADFASGKFSNPSLSRDPLESKKTKVKVYPSIMDALRHGNYGDIFSTIGSKRLYVITKQKWGSSAEQRVGDKVAKGFTPGSAPSNFNSIKKYALRTVARYGKSTSSEVKSSLDKDTGD